MPLAFLACSVIAVCAVVLLLVPFRSGRRPLALFDQFAAFGIVGVLGAYSVGVQGRALWVPGGLALLAGLATYLVANHLARRGILERPGLLEAAFAFAACAISTSLVAYGGQWLFNL